MKKLKDDPIFVKLDNEYKKADKCHIKIYAKPKNVFRIYDLIYKDMITVRKDSRIAILIKAAYDQLKNKYITILRKDNKYTDDTKNFIHSLSAIRNYTYATADFVFHLYSELHDLAVVNKKKEEKPFFDEYTFGIGLIDAYVSDIDYCIKFMDAVSYLISEYGEELDFSKSLLKFEKLYCSLNLCPNNLMNDPTPGSIYQFNIQGLYNRFLYYNLFSINNLKIKKSNISFDCKFPNYISLVGILCDYLNSNNINKFKIFIAHNDDKSINYAEYKNGTKQVNYNVQRNKGYNRYGIIRLHKIK